MGIPSEREALDRFAVAIASGHPSWADVRGAIIEADILLKTMGGLPKVLEALDRIARQDGE